MVLELLIGDSLANILIILECLERYCSSDYIVVSHILILFYFSLFNFTFSKTYSSRNSQISYIHSIFIIISKSAIFENERCLDIFNNL